MRARRVWAGVAIALVLVGPHARAFVSPAVASRCPPGMVLLPAGSFTVHSSKAPATVASLCMDVLEATNDAYAACVHDKKCTEEGIPCSTRATYGKSGKGNLPVTCINWHQATAYCAWRGMRLPTEEEWEWAARGGDNGWKYPWGNALPTNQLCWSGGGTHRDEPCPVGSAAGDINPWGVRDLSGNAWEWTSSSYNPGEENKVARGGYFENNDNELISATNRPAVSPMARWDGLGLRCVRP